MNYTLIIPAAGQGKRMGAGQNKLFLPLCGIPLIVHTLRVFEQDPECERIILAINPAEETVFQQMIAAYELQKPISLVAGGAERQDSVCAALRYIQDAQYVLVHDGARPFVTQQIIDDVVQKAVYMGASICAVPVKDTIKKVEQGVVAETVERAQLWSVQTPQGFHFSNLLHAHEAAQRAGFVGTDDASLLERLDQPVGVVPGSYYNIKITTPEDLVIAESFLRQM